MMASRNLLGIFLALLILNCTATPTSYITERRLRIDGDQQLAGDNDGPANGLREIMEIRASNENALLQKAKDAGMDEKAVSDLLRTRIPVIINSSDVLGNRRTITYKLTSGGISRETVTQKGTTTFSNTHRNILSRGSFDETDKLSTTGIGTRPFGLGLRQSFGSAFDKDWDFIDDADDIFERKGKPADRIGTDHRSIFDLPKTDGVTPRVTTKTDVDDQGRTRTITTRIFDSGPVTTDWTNRGNRHFSSIFDNDDNAFGGRPKSSNRFNIPGLDDTLRQPSLDDFRRRYFSTSTTTPRTATTKHLEWTTTTPRSYNIRDWYFLPSTTTPRSTDTRFRYFLTSTTTPRSTSTTSTTTPRTATTTNENSFNRKRLEWTTTTPRSYNIRNWYFLPSTTTPRSTDTRFRYFLTSTTTPRSTTTTKRNILTDSTNVNTNKQVSIDEDWLNNLINFGIDNTVTSKTKA